MDWSRNCLREIQTEIRVECTGPKERKRSTFPSTPIHPPNTVAEFNMSAVKLSVWDRWIVGNCLAAAGDLSVSS